MTTERDTAHRTPRRLKVADSGVNASMGAGAPASVSPQTAHTQRDRWWDRQLADLTPPTVWSQPPASLRELSLYARHAAWGPQTGFVRGCGIWWCRLVGIPVSTFAYYVAWIAQRPSRTTVALLLYTVLAHTKFVGWLLPWPSWLP
ncbi:MAG: hypothetical protein ACRDT6_16180 [Micromonosporaceae bacterium]